MEQITDNQKVIIVGESNSGKTCLLLKYLNGVYNDKQLSTIGAEFQKKQLVIKKNQFEDIQLKSDSQVKLLFWDIAGQAKFREIGKTFFTGAKGVIFIFDLTCQQSFEKIDQWVKDVSQVLKEPKDNEYASLLVGTKNDLVEKIKVKEDEAKLKMKTLGIQNYYDSSAKTGHNINLIMEHLAAKIIENCFKNQNQNIQKMNDIILLNQKNKSTKNSDTSGKCC